MAKKTFMNPADRFISSVEKDQAQEEQEDRQEDLAKLGAEDDADKARKEQESKPATSSDLNQRKGRRVTHTAPEGMKPAFIEKRTKRVQLVLQPSIFDKVRAIADSKDLSLNEYIHQLLEQAAQQLPEE